MARLNRLDAPPPFELWSADLSAEPAAGELETLSPDEHERAARFVFARDRRRFLAAHVALRRLLAERTGATAGGLRFATGPFGKPSLEGTPAYAFNLTHSEDLALIAMARDGEVGVDVEMLRAVDDASDLAGRNFTSAECTQLTSEVAQDQDLAFLRCWTRKEACL